MIGLEEIERLREIFDVDPVSHDPEPIRLSPADIGFDFFIVDDPPLDRIDQKHLSRLKSSFGPDLFRRK